ncbi:MAG TPA: hypothetical protein DD417_20170 [Elusimicrobia bacterium]|nr:hypothetical protein [Elusimicrobiota bacterium]
MKRRPFITAGEFIEELLGQGRYTFTRAEAARRLGTSPAAVYMSLHRLSRAKRLAMPKAGFYVIVDPQHRATGILPPEWFIHDLMANMARPYYVGLLSAAQLHGAAHHRPQEFQVVIPLRAIRAIRAGGVRIGFHKKAAFDRSQTQEVKTPTGILKASTPETTAWDLIHYAKAAGGLENIVTVLSELAEKLDKGKLQAAVKQHGETVVAQRLGYILDRLRRQDLTKGFAKWVGDAPLRPLDPATTSAGAPKNLKWRLLVNARVEPEA